MSDPILYTIEDGKRHIPLRADLGTVWLIQLEMAELFQTTKQNIAKHLKAIFAGHEATTEKSSVVLMRAMQSCKAIGNVISDHFRGATKVIALGQTASNSL